MAVNTQSQQMTRVKDLIQGKQYDAARKILKSMNTSKSRELLQRMDDRRLGTSSNKLIFGVRKTTLLLLSFVFLVILVGGFMFWDAARVGISYERYEVNQQNFQATQHAVATERVNVAAEHAQIIFEIQGYCRNTLGLEGLDAVDCFNERYAEVSIPEYPGNE